MTNLNLGVFEVYETQLCAPSTDEFRAWLDGIETKSEIPFCGDEQEENADREALEAFYHATDGPNWTDRSNWLSDAPLGEWYGVQADDGGRVIRLILENNNLTGTLPAEIGKLGNLRLFNLEDNQLSGSIPPEIGNMNSLRSIMLSNNRLSGGIPPELGNLKSLADLYIKSNRLSGDIPHEFWNLKSLTDLTLGDNEFTGEIPSEIGDLKALKWVWLNNNLFTGEIPPEIGNLTALVSLRLEYNRLSGSVPPEIGNNTELYEWFMNNISNLSGPLPDEVTNIPSLRRLLLDGTGICAPDNEAFDEWLDNLEEFQGDRCGSP